MKIEWYRTQVGFNRIDYVYYVCNVQNRSRPIPFCRLRMSRAMGSQVRESLHYLTWWLSPPWIEVPCLSPRKKLKTIYRVYPPETGNPAWHTYCPQYWGVTNQAYTQVRKCQGPQYTIEGSYTLTYKVKYLILD